MRVITRHGLGGPEVLTIVDAPEPRPLPTEALVRVTAIGLNLLQARPRAEDSMLGKPPFILGWDISGGVEQSRQTWRFRPGDEVSRSSCSHGVRAHAEPVASSLPHLVRRPASLSHIEASEPPHLAKGCADYPALGIG